MKSLQNVLESVVPEKIIAAVVLILTAAVNAEDIQQAALSGGGSMALVGAYGGTKQTFCLEGDYAYVSEGMSFVIFDLSTPTHPVEMGRCILPDSAWQIEVVHGYAYVADYAKGLQIVDVSDPTAPFVAGGWEPENNMRNGYAVAVRDGYAYLGGNQWITVLNVSDPTAPQAENFVSGDFRAKEMLVDGNYLYMAGYNAGLVVCSLADAATPSIVTNFNPAGYGYFYGLALSDDTLYLTGGTDGLFVVDISNPASPAQVGSYES